MQQLPEIAPLAEKLEEIIAENVEFERPLKADAPLMKELGFDSLDLIETSFSIQEYFDFEFSDKNALEELDAALGGNQVIELGKLTPLGREMLLRRMPELQKVVLPDDLGPRTLQEYYTMETFARLILEFYQALPDTCPDSGEPIVLEDFLPVTQTSNTRVKPPTGDHLIEMWVAQTAANIANAN